jgi:diamine N-acetyltransferase
MGDLLSLDKVSLRALEPSDIDFLCEIENDTSAWKMSNTLAPFSRFQIEQYVFESQKYFS